jgi:hypothetical protein
MRVVCPEQTARFFWGGVMMAKEIADHISRSPAGASELPGEVSGETVKFEGPASSTLQDSKGPRKRKDKGHLHATRHGVLSCYLYEALQSLGEDIKKFRRLERRFRETLKPKGEIAGMLFDRFYSSCLRCVLAARIEANAVTPTAKSSSPSPVVPTLLERDVPTLVWPDGEKNSSIHANFPPDLIRELVLIQRYDRHYSREMFRALSLLLVVRDSGEDGLQQCIAQILGASKQQAGG